MTLPSPELIKNFTHCWSEPMTYINEIPFTQYLYPHGIKKPVSISVAPAVAEKAHNLIEKGLRFECEILSTGEVSVTITDPEDGDLDIRVIPNGPGVREAIEDMVRGFGGAA